MVWGVYPLLPQHRTCGSRITAVSVCLILASVSSSEIDMIPSTKVGNDTLSRWLLAQALPSFRLRYNIGLRSRCPLFLHSYTQVWNKIRRKFGETHLTKPKPKRCVQLISGSSITFVVLAFSASILQHTNSALLHPSLRLLWPMLTSTCPLLYSSRPFC